MISVAIIEPENSGNLGAIARIMANFGFKKLLLVNPKCRIDQEARNRAKHAQKILDDAKTISFEGLEKRFDYLVGTTSKLGSDYHIVRTPLSPRQLAETLKDKKGKIALIIGRESSGLLNKELEKCDFTVTIPTHKKYPALNISHSLGIILYELFLIKNKTDTLSYITPVGKKDKQQILKMLDDVLDNKMEFNTESKKETQKKLWKKLIGKSFLTRREAFSLMGFLKKIR